MLYRVIPQALGPQLRDRLLEYAFNNEHRFDKSVLGTSESTDASVRHSLSLPDLGEHRAAIEKRVAAWIPGLLADLGVTPFQSTGFETELLAYGHGAFFQRHIDLYAGAARSATGADRLLSIVYYFFREPRGFEGGVLRLHTGAGLPQGDGERYVDISVEQDMAVAFSSWLPHEVLGVRCPTGEFRDSRFSINCWALRARSQQTRATPAALSERSA